MKSCWEYKKCGKEIGVIDVKTLEVCPAAIDCLSHHKREHIIDITKRRETKEKLLKSESKLQERIKELSCIYQVSKLIENKGISIEGLLHGILEILPAAFRFSDICCARISYTDNEYTTINFEISEWMLSTREVINEKEMIIDVIYLENKPFQEEEYDMLREIGIRLKSCIKERETQAKVSKSEKKYRTIFNASPDMIYLTDYKGNVLDVNPAWFKKIKITPEEMQKMNIIDFFAGDSQEKLWKFIKEIRSGKAVKGMELKINNFSGGISEFEIDSVPIMEDQRITQVLSIARDVTERKEMENKLKKSEEKYRYLVNSVSDLLLEVDLKGKFTYASPQLYDIFGFTPSEIINKSMRKFIHPDDMYEVLEALKEAYHTREDITIEYRTLHKDGHYVYASAKGSLLDNNRFFGVVRDISERKIAEQKLRESEEKFRLISENAYDLIGLLNKKFKYEYINENAFQQTLGYSVKIFLGNQF